jgi:hypothetical protein
MAGKSGFPGPYVDSVPREGADSMMEYPPFEKMAIGAHGQGLPKGGMNDLKSLDHVGGSAGKKKS